MERSIFLWPVSAPGSAFVTGVGKYLQEPEPAVKVVA